MHYWGDEWFQQYGDQLYEAIELLGRRMRKWAKVGVCKKEKWGAMRTDFLTFWDGGLSQIFFGYGCWWGGSWIEKFVHFIDHSLIPYKKTKYGWLRVGLADFNGLIGLRKLVNKWQVRMINKAFQVTCREYPDIIDELVSDVDCYNCIKPCKWGDVDGEAIHRKYWKSLTVDEFLEDIQKNVKAEK